MKYPFIPIFFCFALNGFGAATLPVKVPLKACRTLVENTSQRPRESPQLRFERYRYFSVFRRKCFLDEARNAINGLLLLPNRGYRLSDDELTLVAATARKFKGALDNDVATLLLSLGEVSSPRIANFLSTRLEPWRINRNFAYDVLSHPRFAPFVKLHPTLTPPTEDIALNSDGYLAFMAFSAIGETPPRTLWAEWRDKAHYPPQAIAEAPQPQTHWLFDVNVTEEELVTRLAQFKNEIEVGGLADREIEQLVNRTTRKPISLPIRRLIGDIILKGASKESPWIEYYVDGILLKSAAPIKSASGRLIFSLLEHPEMPEIVQTNRRVLIAVKRLADIREDGQKDAIYFSASALYELYRPEVTFPDRELTPWQEQRARRKKEKEEARASR